MYAFLVSVCMHCLHAQAEAEAPIVHIYEDTLSDDTLKQLRGELDVVFSKGV